MNEPSTHLIQWSDDYLVGVYQIDLEHRELFRFANLILELEGPSKDVLAHIFEGLLKYTEFHFAGEEQLMRERDYPGLAEHATLHQAILRQMQGVLKHANTLEELQTKLKNLLQSWVVKHVLTVDLALAQHLKQQGISPTS